MKTKLIALMLTGFCLVACNSNNSENNEQDSTMTDTTMTDDTMTEMDTTDQNNMGTDTTSSADSVQQSPQP